MLSSILTTGAVNVTLQQFALCTLCSLALGVAAALLFMVKNDNYTPSFAAALALLPVIVQVSALADTVVPAFIVVTAITQVSNGSTSRARI